MYTEDDRRWRHGSSIFSCWSRHDHASVFCACHELRPSLQTQGNNQGSTSGRLTEEAEVRQVPDFMQYKIYKTTSSMQQSSLTTGQPSASRPASTPAICTSNKSKEQIEATGNLSLLRSACRFNKLLVWTGLRTLCCKQTWTFSVINLSHIRTKLVTSATVKAPRRKKAEKNRLSSCSNGKYPYY